jgi:hypothetical protein
LLPRNEDLKAEKVSKNGAASAPFLFCGLTALS